jgi:hypothetical protein
MHTLTYCYNVRYKALSPSPRLRGPAKIEPDGHLAKSFDRLAKMNCLDWVQDERYARA